MLLSYCLPPFLPSGRERDALNITMDMVREYLATHLVKFVAKIVPYFLWLILKSYSLPSDKQCVTLNINNGNCEGLFNHVLSKFCGSHVVRLHY